MIENLRPRIGVTFLLVYESNRQMMQTHKWGNCSSDGKITPKRTGENSASVCYADLDFVCSHPSGGS